MVPVENLWAFIVASVVLIVIPGPSVLFVIGRSLALGRLGGLLSVVGNALGMVPLVAAVALGVGALVAQSVVIFTIIKFAGALYLVYLGVQAIRHRADAAAAVNGAVATRSHWRQLGEGFIVGVTNPKTIAFFVAVLPQFVDFTAGSIPLQLFELGVRVHRARAHLRLDLGAGRERGAQLVRALAEACGTPRRDRRRDDDRPRRRARAHGQQALNGAGRTAGGAAQGNGGCIAPQAMHPPFRSVAAYSAAGRAAAIGSPVLGAGTAASGAAASASGSGRPASRSFQIFSTDAGVRGVTRLDDHVGDEAGGETEVDRLVRHDAAGTTNMVPSVTTVPTRHRPAGRRRRSPASTGSRRGSATSSPPTRMS